MLGNDLKSTWRILRRNKGLSFISITGLAEGKATSAAIALGVHFLAGILWMSGILWAIAVIISSLTLAAFQLNGGGAMRKNSNWRRS